MATGLVIHISSGEDKHTEVLTDELIRIGSCDNCDLRLRMSDLPRRPESDGVVLSLARTNGHYRVTDFDKSLELIHNGKPMESDSIIGAGDEIHIEPSNLSLQFFPLRSLPAVVTADVHETHVAPFIEQAAIESAATARRDDAKVFLREFTRELVREINPSTKLITLAMAIFLVGGILYIGFALFKEIQTSRRIIDEQRAQLAAMDKQFTKNNQQLSDITKANKEIRDSLSLAVKLRSDFGNGVCLIAGSFYFVESGTGRPLRYPEAQTTESGSAVQTGTDQVALTPEGKGPIAEYEFVGSGFYVGGGYVMTNRHIAQPWQADERAQSMNGVVRGQPRVKKLMAYFPDHPQAFSLKFRQASSRDDLAVCSLDVKDLPTDIPALPLESESGAVAVGKTVVMMGYPSGPDRLLALLDDSESRGIQQRYASLDSLLNYLAESKRIQPLTTQGNITDLNTRRIAYDARTAEGGSGAPLFGPSGRVIGVNFAVFTENQGSNFAVPIQSASTLLERAGWVAPTDEDTKNENTGAAGTTHPVTPSAK
ncbi:MAG TPA: trypsin-like peptidase domain-containing protein [Pyrinomonadaceae bacterium]|jgi:S1-C subfamily serine protease|nr:trypsin-like peptidase domain-containing protein [Pyrinomonadaceae bacterium]